MKTMVFHFVSLDAIIVLLLMGFWLIGFCFLVDLLSSFAMIFLLTRDCALLDSFSSSCSVPRGWVGDVSRRS